jgi:gluconolactonase
VNLPNGLAFSPDESVLYVSNTRPDPKMYAFDMQTDGTASNQRVFTEMPLVNSSEKNGVPDGMKIDSAGRVYCTGPGGVWIWEPGGVLIGVMEFPELAVTKNIAWGGDDLRTMFVTGHTSVYSLRTTTPGTPLPVFA